MPEGNQISNDSSSAAKPTPAGPLIGTIIVVALLLVGAIYFLFQQIEKKRNIEPPAYIPGDQT